MKKKWLKKLACAGMVLATSLLLAGCGGKNANDALAKENVYKMDEISLPDLGTADYNISALFYKDNKVYLLAEVWNWEVSNESEVNLISMNVDGTDANVVKLEKPEKKDASADAENDVNQPVEEDQPVIDDGMMGDTSYEYTSYYNYNIGADNKVYAIKNYTFEDYSDPENYVSISEAYISSWNMDGTLANEVLLEGLRTEDEWIGIRNISVAQDGTVNLILSGNNIYKMSIDAQGKASEKKEVSEELAKVLQNSNTILSKEDGTLLVTYYDENDWAKQYIVIYNPETDTLGQVSELPPIFTNMGYNALTPGVSNDMLFCTNTGIYAYNIGDEDVTLKMSYINSDMNISYFEGIVELSANTFLGIFNENYEGMQAGIFTYVDPADIPDKSVIVLAGNYVDSDLKRRIVEYNRSNDEYKIVVKEYNTYSTYDDWQAGYTQLNNDIISGNMPDILITDNLPVEKYISKGLLADVGKLIERDEELSGTEFMQNIFDAYSMDGKLYYVIPSFRVQTMIGKKSILGERSSWTMKDMQDLAATLPENTLMMGDMTRDSFMNVAMTYCGNDFVDVASGKCNFDSEGFIALMEYAKSLPVEINEDYYGEDYWMKYQSRYRDERTILYNLYIASPSNLNYTINGYFGAPVSYVGFPGESGQGAIADAIDSYALYSKSKNLDEAWNFVKYYLSEEYQSDLGYGLPVNKKCFLQRMQEALSRPYYIDENGEKVEYDDTFYLNGESITLPTLTKEQVDEVISVVESANKCSYSNQNVINIINEEIAAFYSGQKSAQEVAKVIQSRVGVYVQENQ